MAAGAGRVNSPRHERGGAMIERVHAEARAALSADDARCVRDAVAIAISAREPHVHDDHDPRYLHPGRTVRVLLMDTPLRAATALAAAALADSVDAALAAAPDAVGAAVAQLVNALPLPGAGDDDLLERLITADADAALAALAERLDQARHLHLRRDLDWDRFHASIRADYTPAARRLCPQLARRFERWADAFERRLLLRG
ncbi:MAG TPA: hypothetical protein VMN60_07165 [Longimicrobiales bacterium]|nr:hypothetical protein [Longimicrobiales bacterium]